MSARGKRLVVGPWIVCFSVALALVVAPAHTRTFAQSQPPQPVDQPAEFAAVRAKYEQMTREQYIAAGYPRTPCALPRLWRVYRLNSARWESTPTTASY